MKKIFVILVLSMFLFSCEHGRTVVNLNGDEQSLPPELKGLKVYDVQVGGLSSIKVAILNGEVNSVTYPVGKVTETTVIVNNDSGSKRVIECTEIISETDDVIVIKKK